MNGMYVIKEAPVMMRQRDRHVRASVGEEEAVSADRAAGDVKMRLTDHVRPVGRQV